jgi:hypothetical protein
MNFKKLFTLIAFLSVCFIGKAQTKEFDVEINEIMADPTPVVGLPGWEYVELYNRTSNQINLKGWTLSFGTTVKQIDSAYISPKGYLLLAHINAVKDLSVYGKVYGFSSFSVNNTGQTVVLRDSSNHVISAVAYTDDWYKDDYKKDGGWSLEQIDLDNPCGGENNWKASIDKSGGTPGKKNSVFASNPDLSIPELDRACVIDTMTIELFFSEPLDSTCLNNPLNYAIDNGIGNPVKVIMIPPFYNSVILKLQYYLKQSILYTVTFIKSLRDCSGNMSDAELSAKFAIPVSASTGDIIINEILTNPKDNGAQFVEIYNVSNKIIDLKDLLLCTMDTNNNILQSEKDISVDGFLIFPQDYYALSVAPDLVKKQYYTTNLKGFIQLASFPQFNIDEGVIVIADKAGQVIDKLVYTPEMQYPLLNDTKGVSLERISFYKATQDKTNWHSASGTVGFATPAYKNSQYADINTPDNAVSLSPDIFSPDNDGRDDVLFINYKFDEPGYLANVTIYDSRGRQVKYLVKNELIGTAGSFIWDGINDKNEKALIGIYVVYFEVHDLKGKVKHYKKTTVLGGKI